MEKRKRGRPKGITKEPRRMGEVMALRDEGLTLEQIADRLGLSRQRVQQICAKSPNYRPRERGRTQAALKFRSLPRMIAALADVVIPEPVAMTCAELEPRPLVYVLFDRGEVLYVGQSRKGLGRVLTAEPKSQKQFACARATKALIYYCDDLAQMGAVEARLILDLTPPHNVEWQMAKPTSRRSINGFSIDSHFSIDKIGS